jgi:uncharacterized protein (DUF1919 family)
MNNFPSIISNTCWGGMITHYFGSEYSSPFTGSFIIGKDYIRLIRNIDNIDLFNISSITNLESSYHELPIENQDAIYPVIILKDLNLEVHFPHYDIGYDIKSTWSRRMERFDWSNYIIKFSKSRLATENQLKEFAKMELPCRKVLITDNVMMYTKYETSNFKVIQSCISSPCGYVDDEPIESLHNIGWNLFGYKFDREKILSQLGWI